MNALKIFVDFGAPKDVLDVLRERTAGHELIFPSRPGASILDKAERDPQFGEADVAFGQPDVQAIAESTRLKWIHVSTSGIARYDTPQFRALVKERGIPVSNSAGVYGEACAVHTLSFMLAQARKLPAGLHARIAGGTRAWHELRNASGTLGGETVLIVGLGTIGRRLIELLRPFGMSIKGYRRRPSGDEGVPVVSREQLADALGDADHVINILPDSSETRDFFDAARFAVTKAGAIFYNIGRGSTVDQGALLAALRSGHLQAAWLDVTEPEPLPEDHPLWSQPNCFITPHVAGGHFQESRTLVQHFLKNLGRFVRGEPLLDRVM